MLSLDKTFAWRIFIDSLVVLECFEILMKSKGRCFPSIIVDFTIYRRNHEHSLRIEKDGHIPFDLLYIDIFRWIGTLVPLSLERDNKTKVEEMMNIN